MTVFWTTFTGYMIMALLFFVDALLWSKWVYSLLIPVDPLAAGLVACTIVYIGSATAVEIVQTVLTVARMTLYINRGR